MDPVVNLTLTPDEAIFLISAAELCEGNAECVALQKPALAKLYDAELSFAPPIDLRASLLEKFPWLKTSDEVSGADVVQALCDWYTELNKPAEGMHKCDDCGQAFAEGALVRPIPGIAQRMDPGGPMPSGECPDCGALCYPTENLLPVGEAVDVLSVPPERIKRMVEMLNPAEIIAAAEAAGITIQTEPGDEDGGYDCLFQCPACGAKDEVQVEVVIRTLAFVVISDDGEIQGTDTDGEGDHEWDGGSTMRCCECDHMATVQEFEDARAKDETE